MMLNFPALSIPQGIASAVFKTVNSWGAYAPRNDFLEGPYAPVNYERVETQLDVIGRIPKELNGTYMRIGPNPLHVKNPATYHWFTGDGMVHAVKIKNGQFEWYRNRWVGTDRIQDAFARPRAPGARNGIAQEVNTNIIGHNGRIWALVEAGALPVELDAELNTIKHGLFDSNKVAPFSAHPHLDPETGELHTITYSPTHLNHIEYVVVNAEHQVIKSQRIPMKRQPMIHDCALTQKYVLIFDFPVLFSKTSLLKGSKFPYVWKDKSYARVGLLPRDGTPADIKWFKLDQPCMAFHSCNAFDQDDGSVVLDLVVHPKIFPQGAVGPELSTTTFERWTFKPNSSKVEQQILSNALQEFPRFDERLSTKPYRFAYAIDASQDFNKPRYLYRHDVLSGETIAREFPAGVGPGEVNFVPRHQNAAEDDGWLLTYVMNNNTKTSDFVILDAKDILAEPVAVVKLPWLLPFGFHSNWVPD